MSITTRTSGNAAIITGRNAKRGLARAQRRAAKRVWPTTENRLRRYPPRYTGPRDWDSERQRRAYFATNGFGGGIPYRRTGRLKSGWRYDQIVNSKGATIIIENRTPYAGYVYGTLALSGFQRMKSNIHKQGGWPDASPIAQGALRDIQQQTRRNITDLVADMVTYIRVGSLR